MKRKTFNKLSDKDKAAVLAKYPDAEIDDGHWYHLHAGQVLTRTGKFIGYGRQVPPHVAEAAIGLVANAALSGSDAAGGRSA